MSKYIRKAPETEFIIGTEIGIIHRMQKENPDKIFYPVTEMAVCPNMKKITLEKVLWSLEDLSYEIIVPPDIMEKARLSIERMLQVI
jgi:quinolinate synthase